MIHFTVVLSSFSKYCIVVVFCSVLYCWRFMCRSMYVQILLWILFLSTAWFLPLVYFLVLFEFSRVVLTKWWPGRGKVFEWLILGSLPNLILYLLAATLGLFCLRSKPGSCFFIWDSALQNCHWFFGLRWFIVFCVLWSVSFFIRLQCFLSAV